MSQLTFEMGEGGGAGIKKMLLTQVTLTADLSDGGGGQGRNKEKRYSRGVTTDLSDV